MTPTEARADIARQREQLAEATRIGAEVRQRLARGADTGTGSRILRERTEARGDGVAWEMLRAS